MAYSLKDKEGTIINNVREDFFKEFDCRKLIGNIDFSVAIPQTGKELFPEIEYLLWAEAKKGALTNSAFHDAFIQLIFTIGRERTFDKFMPPKFLGAFDAEKIAFIPFSAVMDVFSQNDFDWSETPSNHESKEFKQLKELVRNVLTQTSQEKDNVYFFNFFNDKKELQRFIKRNFVSGRDSVQRMRINHNNFTHIYAKWCKEVRPSIAVEWDNVKKSGLLDADFYLADIMSGDNNTLMENLHVLLKSNHYELDRKVDTYGFVSSSSVPFYDNMQAHSKFWSKYSRPPRQEYWNKIVERRDLLVPQDVRERKGSYFTPAIWVEKSQEYLADVLGENWQEEYYIWDCCAGTGNLLRGLSNKYNIWASTLDKADVDVMLQQIESGMNLLPSHVFQFDFLNDEFTKLPKGLQDIINDEEKRKKLVIYINPPYAEAGNYGKSKAGTSIENKMNAAYKKYLGAAANELFALFLIRIYKEIPSCFIAQFSTMKHVIGPNFHFFRQIFKPSFERGFLVPANTFDNVKGQFPIGFYIWDCSKTIVFDSAILDVYNSNGEQIGEKAIKVIQPNRYLNDWITPKRDTKDPIGYLRIQGNDFQRRNYIYIISVDNKDHTFPVTKNNLIDCVIYLSIRQCIEANWLNDRDSYSYPDDGWKLDRDFQSDCLAFALFHGQNKITSAGGENHWIPFTEQQVKAPDCFKSHMMSDFIAGKFESSNADTLFSEEESLIPSEPIIFTPAAAAVIEAGRKIWEYYMTHKKNVFGAAPVNVNASFYDIREYFQGRDEKGKMNSESSDKTYMSLLKDLRAYQKVLAKQIEKKVYLYGFLKGEAEIDPTERLHELERQNAELRHKLQSQQSQQVTVHIDHLDTLNLGDNVENKFTK